MKKVRWIAILLVVVMTISHPAMAQTKVDFVFISPVPNALYVPTETSITLNSPELIEGNQILEGFIDVMGVQSGRHDGKAILSDDHTSIIFKPFQAFANGEAVSVSIKPGIKTISGAVLNGYSTHFKISSSPVAGGVSTQYPPDHLKALVGENLPAANIGPQSLLNQQYKTIPTEFPVIDITSPANATGDGFVFLSNFSINFSQPSPSYLLIVDNQGEPVYYKGLPPNAFATDFKKQPNGWLTYYDLSVFKFLIMDSTYAFIDTIAAGNGYPTDNHELRILPNGHALLMIYDRQTVDMTAYGGLADATVVGLVVQELDTNKNVVFQWRSWDHLDTIPYTDSDVDLTVSTPIDYVHGNAIEMDYDGHLLISSRHLSEIIKINRINGDVMWILGGKGNQFDFGTDEGFSYQHDIRRLANGHISIFDNHNLGPAPQYSRAVEYEIDEYNKTAVRVWQFRNTPDTYSFAMGNAQRLPNGNTMIGWGSANPPTLTEVKPDGSKAFEITLGNGDLNYRAFRFPWVGHPVNPPDLVFETAGGVKTLYYSWNGATEIASYKIYGGVMSNSMSLLSEVARTGFENHTDVTTWANDNCFFQVMPVDKNGHETQYSNQVFIMGPACHPLYLPQVSTLD